MQHYKNLYNAVVINCIPFVHVNRKLVFDIEINIPNVEFKKINQIVCSKLEICDSLTFNRRVLDLSQNLYEFYVFIESETHFKFKFSKSFVNRAEEIHT